MTNRPALWLEINNHQQLDLDICSHSFILSVMFMFVIYVCYNANNMALSPIY